MFNKAERLISSRNLKPKKKEGFLKIISIFSFLGIMLGVAILIIVWAIRLGLFLLVRVFQVGEDKRFHAAKNSYLKFLMWFSISALWVFLTTANALTIILNNTALKNDGYFYFGFL